MINRLIFQKGSLLDWGGIDQHESHRPAHNEHHQDWNDSDTQTRWAFPSFPSFDLNQIILKSFPVLTRTVFFITLACNRSHLGAMNEANVHIIFQIGLSPLSNLTMTLKRKKICIRNDLPLPLQLPPDSIATPEPAAVQPLAPSQSLPSHLESLYTPLYIFIVFTVCFTVCAAFLSLLCYIRMQKSNRNSQYLYVNGNVFVICLKCIYFENFHWFPTFLLWRNYSGISTQLTSKSTGQLLAHLQRIPHNAVQMPTGQESVFSTPNLTHHYLRHQPPPTHPPPQPPSSQQSNNTNKSSANGGSSSSNTSNSRPTTYSTGTRSIHSDRTGYQSVDPFADHQSMFPSSGAPLLPPQPSAVLSSSSSSSQQPRPSTPDDLNHNCATRPVSRHSPNYCLPKKPLSPYSSHTSLFDFDQVRLHNLQCAGQYGRVYTAVYRDLVNCEERDIVVKTLVSSASKMVQSSFIREGLLLQGLRHPHLNSCTLVSKDNRQPLLLYPELQQCNLKQALLHRRGQPGQMVQPLQPPLLIRLALQLADALAYVHENCLLHKDLAARNCVISGLEMPHKKVSANSSYVNTAAIIAGNNHKGGSFINNRSRMVDDTSWNQPGPILRLSDTALARDLFPEDYCTLSGHGQSAERRPVRWMPYECLLGKKHTTQSDVWAFGVTIWEMLTLAEMPYEAIEPDEIAKLLW